MAQTNDKAQLIADLAAARSLISAQTAHLRRDLDFSTRAKQSFKKGPFVWLGGAAVVGLFFSSIAGRKKTVVVPSRKGAKVEATAEKAGKYGLVLGALKMAFDLARPALTAWVARLVTDYTSRGFRTSPDRRP